MFQFPALAPYAYVFSTRSIQESRDQRSFDSFPGLIAVFHALHRHLTPRHPPRALSSLTTIIPASLYLQNAKHHKTRIQSILCRPATTPPVNHRSPLTLRAISDTLDLDEYTSTSNCVGNFDATQFYCQIVKEQTLRINEFNSEHSPRWVEAVSVI